MTYGELKSAIGDWIARSDIGDTTLDLIIDLVEAKINRVLRIRAMEAVYFRLLDADASAPVPTTFKGWKEAFLYKGTGTDDTMPALTNALVGELTQASGLKAFREFQVSSASALAVARVGTKFFIAGKPEGEFSLGGIVYNAFPALTAEAGTNWLTDNAPDLLLAGSLSEAAQYVKNEAEILRWSAKFDSILSDLQTEQDMEQYEGPQIVRRSGVWNA